MIVAQLSGSARAPACSVRRPRRTHPLFHPSCPVATAPLGHCGPIRVPRRSAAETGVPRRSAAKTGELPRARRLAPRAFSTPPACRISHLSTHPTLNPLRRVEAQRRRVPSHSMNHPPAMPPNASHCHPSREKKHRASFHPKITHLLAKSTKNSPKKTAHFALSASVRSLNSQLTQLSTNL